MQELTLRILAKLDDVENLAASGLAAADIFDSNCLNGSEVGIRRDFSVAFEAIWAASASRSVANSRKKVRSNASLLFTNVTVNR